MKLDIKKKNGYLITINAVLSWGDIQSDFNSELKKIKSNYQLQGFRKGKVPDKIFRKNLGGSIDAQFVDSYINTYYRQALKESKLVPVNTGQIKDVDFKEGGDFKFSVQFEMIPDFKLPAYQKKVTITTNKYVANAKDVNQSLEDLRARYAKAQSVNRALKSGDFIYADFQKFNKDGELIEEGKLKDHYIKIGEGLFVDKLEKPFIGKKINDEVKISIDQNNHKVDYNVKINKIEETILPDINDDLAKLVDPNIKTIKELKSKIKESIQMKLDDENKKEFNNKIIEYFIDKSKFEVPPSIADTYKESLEQDYKQKFQQNYDEEKMSKEISDLSKNTVKWHLIKELLIKEYKINLQESDIVKQIKDFIEKNPTQKDQINEFYNKPENKQKLAEDLINQSLFKELDKYFINKVKESSTDKIRTKKGE